MPEDPPLPRPQVRIMSPAGSKSAREAAPSREGFSSVSARSDSGGEAPIVGNYVVSGGRTAVVPAGSRGDSADGGFSGFKAGPAGRSPRD